MSARPTRSAGDVKAWKKHRDAGRKAEKKNDLVEAEKQFRLATLQASGFPQPDQRYADSGDDWARVVFLQRRYFTAQLFWERVLNVEAALHGTNHLAVARTLSNLGDAYSFGPGL
jgi:hypothetical protein